MKQLVGQVSRLKYQVNEYIPQTLETIDPTNTEQVETIIQTGLDSIRETITLMDIYIHKDIALVFEHKDIFTNIKEISDALVDNGMDPNRLNRIHEDDYITISQMFIQTLSTKHNQEWLAQLLQKRYTNETL